VCCDPYWRSAAAAAAAAAGKSTLMGRLLSELGQVSQKEVHKNQKESAQAGKVRHDSSTRPAAAAAAAAAEKATAAAALFRRGVSFGSRQTGNSCNSSNTRPEHILQHQLLVQCSLSNLNGQLNCCCTCYGVLALLAHRQHLAYPGIRYLPVFNLAISCTLSCSPCRHPSHGLGCLMNGQKSAHVASP
jgi:hypothetical protein